MKRDAAKRSLPQLPSPGIPLGSGSRIQQRRIDVVARAVLLNSDTELHRRSAQVPQIHLAAAGATRLEHDHVTRATDRGTPVIGGGIGHHGQGNERFRLEIVEIEIVSALPPGAVGSRQASSHIDATRDLSTEPRPGETEIIEDIYEN